MFTLHEVCSNPYNDRLLRDDDKPLYVQNSWPKNDKQKYSLVLRRHLTQGLIENGDTWRRLSIDECSLDVDAELDEHNSTCSSILTTSSNSSRSRSSISSTTASVLSLASLSSNGSSRCSFSSNSSSGVSSGSSSSFSSTETPEKNRKVHITRRALPPIPRAETPVAKVYPISAEENIQSYFSMPMDEEGSDASPVKENESDSRKRFPLPVPRRILSYPVAKVSSTCSSEKEMTVSKPFCKSWSSSSCYSTMTWIKARGPTAQSWQNRSRSARIRSATISSPVEHMANLSLHNRSRSSDNYRLSVINSSSNSLLQSKENAVFPQRSASLSRTQSTSSVVSTSKTLDYPLISPSTKLRPLSLAPNSSIAFPSRPSSLLSTQSHSTSTLMASSSTLSLTSPSVESKSQSFTVSIGHLDALSPTPPPSSRMHESSSTKFDTEERSPSSNFDEECQAARLLEKGASSNCSSRDGVAVSCSVALKKNGQALTDNTKHCPSCCRYDNCFYI
ncbi:Ras-associating (RA) domain [Trinorchestia longiramus]|nr:Ras-associating (RA) domain [Trinorchestia longiramus]